MAIKIKEVNGTREVYQDDKLVGTCRKFCCGIDFRPKGKPNALFSILKVQRYDESKLKKSIKAILSIDIPDASFHWNYNPEFTKEEILSYKTRLQNLQT